MYLIRRMFSWRIANPVLSGTMSIIPLDADGCVCPLTFVMGQQSEGAGSLNVHIHCTRHSCSIRRTNRRSQSHEQRLVSRKSYRRILWNYRSVDRFLALDSAPSGVDLLWVLAAAAIGALGGMFGVNLQKS